MSQEAEGEDPFRNPDEEQQEEASRRPSNTGSQPHRSRNSSIRSNGNNDDDGAGHVTNPLRQPPNQRRDSSNSQSQSRPGSAPFARGDSASGSWGANLPRRKSSMGGTLGRQGTARDMANQLRRSHSVASGLGDNASGTLRKKATLASMMLSGSYEPDGDNNAGSGGAFGDYAYADEEGGEDEDGGAHGDKMQAEQIFMPNMKREQYIPVRIARDKVKQVLAEMAQMKTLHYAAIDTMEKQYEFLKAQLEHAVATYTRKLTSDYNDRVTALEAEYKRRLDRMNDTAMGDLQRTLEQSKKDAEANERRLQAKLDEQAAETEQERKMFKGKLEMEAQKFKDLEAKFAEQVRVADDLTVQLRVAKGEGRDHGDSLTETARTDAIKVIDLEKQVRDLESSNSKLKSTIESKDDEIAALQNELAEAQEQLALGGLHGHEGAHPEDDAGNIIVGGDDGYDGGGGEITVGADDDDGGEGDEVQYA